jgi:YidC/Oxa1 family membrane protein insertase
MSLVESGGRMVSWGIDLSKAAGSVSGFGKAFPYYVLVAITIGTGFYQQRQMTARLPKDAVNAQMQMVTKIFPAIIGFISLSVPAGVVVYFIISNVWQIGQQAVTFRAYPPTHLAGGGAGGGGGKGDGDKPAPSSGTSGGGSGSGKPKGGGGRGREPGSSRGGRAGRLGGAGGAGGAQTPPARDSKKPTGRQQPKGKRPPPSPRPKGLPPQGKGGSGPNGAGGSNGTSAKNTRRKDT